MKKKKKLSKRQEQQVVLESQQFAEQLEAEAVRLAELFGIAKDDLWPVLGAYRNAELTGNQGGVHIIFHNKSQGFFSMSDGDGRRNYSIEDNGEVISMDARYNWY